MKLLWITNILFPDIAAEIGVPAPVSGGWMKSSAAVLLKDTDMRFAVATVYDGNRLIRSEIDGIVYYLLPKKRDNTQYDRSLEKSWTEINADFEPDIVHIHGTEFAHGLACIKACGGSRVVVSIQGLVSVCQRYFYAGLTPRELTRSVTLRDIVKRDTIRQRKSQFGRRGALEVEYIRSVGHVIGRTEWDKAHVLAINPGAVYHTCNETLRPEFYRHEWEYARCEKHSIFISQAHAPLKGLHQVLKAMPLVLEKYPDARIYVAGNDPTRRPWYLIAGYGKYLASLIKRTGLQDRVVFTGQLDEKAMCGQYLKSNVFVCPSSIENSPNSLGEAQLLGVPCVASYVGGSPDMMQGLEPYLYRFEEVEMLARKIIGVFDLKDAYPTTKERTNAQLRHDPIANRDALLKIYHQILRTQ